MRNDAKGTNAIVVTPSGAGGTNPKLQGCCAVHDVKDAEVNDATHTLTKAPGIIGLKQLPSIKQTSKPGRPGSE